jgi:hypothetical protein
MRLTQKDTCQTLLDTSHTDRLLGSLRPAGFADAFVFKYSHLYVVFLVFLILVVYILVLVFVLVELFFVTPQPNKLGALRFQLGCMRSRSQRLNSLFERIFLLRLIHFTPHGPNYPRNHYGRHPLAQVLTNLVPHTIF